MRNTCAQKTWITIAGILGSLDEKIEINRRKIAELEALAKLIYDHWFIQFDFPDANGKPYKSSGGKMVWNETLKRNIPEGWTSDMLSAFVSIQTEIVNPQNMSQATIVEHYSIPAYDEGRFPSFESARSILSNKFAVPPRSILFSKLNPQFKRLWNPLRLTESAITSTEFIVYLPFNDNEHGYVYSVLNSDAFYKFSNAIASSSTGSRKRLDPNDTKRFAVVLPPEALLLKFSEIIDSGLTQINKIKLEIKKLTSCRDWLLPMLMNGQVTFK